MSVLQARDVNLPMEQTATNAQASTQGKTQTTEQTMRKMIAEDSKKQTTSYVSPSDAIQSPASQKLAGFKQRQINRQINSKKPAARTLFARAVSNSGSDLKAQDSVTAKDQQV